MTIAVAKLGLALASTKASIACSCRMLSSNKRPTSALLILQNFSRHVENTFLRFNVGTASPGVGSKSRESANPIAFCVAVFSLEPSSRIRKLQNFLAISSWCVSIGSNLLNSHSRVYLSSEAPVSENPLVSQVVDLQFQSPILIAHQYPEHNDFEYR